MFTGNHYHEHIRVGWPSENREVQEVDLVGHAWFFPSYLTQAFWLETISLDNCEDMQVSFVAQKYYGLKTYCPPHPPEDKSVWSSLTPWEKGNDGKASSFNGQIDVGSFYNQRTQWMSLAKSRGWKWQKDQK